MQRIYLRCYQHESYAKNPGLSSNDCNQDILYEGKEE